MTTIPKRLLKYWLSCLLRLKNKYNATKMPMMADTSKYISRIVFSKVLRDYLTNLKVIRADLFIHEKIVCEWGVNLMALRKSKKFLKKTLLNSQGALFLQNSTPFGYTTTANNGYEHKKAPHCWEAFCGPTWNRTKHLLIMSQLL